MLLPFKIQSAHYLIFFYIEINSPIFLKSYNYRIYFLKFSIVLKSQTRVCPFSVWDTSLKCKCKLRVRQNTTTYPVWMISLLIPREWKLAWVLSHEDLISIQIFLVSVILSWVLFKSVSLLNSSPNYLKFLSSVTALECALLLLQILALLDWVLTAHPSIWLGKSALV